MAAANIADTVSQERMEVRIVVMQKSSVA